MQRVNATAGWARDAKKVPQTRTSLLFAVSIAVFFLSGHVVIPIKYNCNKLYDSGEISFRETPLGG